MEEYTNICPTCDKELKSVQGMKLHHSSVHDEQLPTGRPVECGQCGEEFRTFSDEYCQSCIEKYGSPEKIPDFREKVSEGLRGRSRSEKAKRKMSEAHEGKTLSEETRQKIGDFHRGREVSEETREKIAEGNIGKVVSEEAKEKMSNSHTGKVLSEEHRQAIASAHKQKYDSHESLPFSDRWKIQRKKALERDDYECQKCFMDNEEHLRETGIELSVHHIIPRAEFQNEDGSIAREAAELSNLVSLCNSCHVVVERQSFQVEADQHSAIVINE